MILDGGALGGGCGRRVSDPQVLIGDDGVVMIVLFRSVYGLRKVERQAAQRLRAFGHEVHIPDLYAGQTAAILEAGFALKDRIGWDTVAGRAGQVLAELPGTAVLAGLSMGCGVIHDLLPSRPDTAAVLLLHALADLPTGARPGLPVRGHIAAPDSLTPAEQLTTWQDAAHRKGAAATVHTYPGAGHFYTDDTLPDYDHAASELTWHRVIEFLDELESGARAPTGKR
ncbi:dienelactone hydrolase family protein [Nocardia sp. NPDC051052]|uniref:dienelactone hydrolase family protein n=1 Tax=Nocardia sp. NPDC051052 TaxID=3364322 RepID=UPI00378F95EF